jgi:glycosyltransferase involved in cell wall biosynthesis
MSSKLTSKKIFYLVTQSEFGGAQKYVFELSKKAKEEGAKVIVATGLPGNERWLEKLARKHKIKIITLQNLKRFNPLKNLFAIYELKIILKKEKPDILHLNSSMSGFIGSIAGRLARVKKIIYTTHGLILNEPNLAWPVKLFYWLCEWIGNKLTHQIITVSNFDKKSILSYRLAPEKKITTIHNGLDRDQLLFFDKNEARSFLKKKYDISKGKILIGTIANFYENKGLIYLLKAAKKITHKNENIVFVVIGDGGPLKKEIIKEIKKYNLEKNFLLLGSISSAFKYLKAFDILVSSSIKEGFPYFMVEALASGIPIVATRTGGIPEIIENNKNGLLIKPKKEKEIITAISKILGDKKIQKTFQENNSQKIKKFTLKKTFEKTIKIYQK